MKKINFEAGTQVSPAKVTINNVDHNVTPAVWEGNTPLSPFVLNKMQDNIEEETKTTQTTEVSEELTIENCAGVKGKLDIKNGKSIQEGEPSTDNIIPIRNVGDNINLFDKDNVTTNEYYTINTTSSSFNWCTSQIKVKPNTNYYLSGNKLNNTTAYIVLLNKNKKIIKAVDSYYNTHDIKTTSETEYIGLSIANYPDNSDMNTIKLEEGSISTPYTPYNCGSADFKVENGNKLPIEFISGTVSNGVTLTLDNDKSIILNGTASETSLFNVVMSKTIQLNNYKLFMSKVNGTITSGNVQFFLYTSDYNANQNITLTSNINAINTILNNNSYKIQRIVIPKGTVLNNVKIRVSIFKEETTYIPHQKQIKSFPFTEGQVLHKGDYLASDGIHQTKGILILTGNENFGLNTEGFSLASGVVNALTNDNLLSKSSLVCNFYKNYTTLDSLKNQNYGIGFIYSINNLYIRDARFTTNTEFKAFLAEQYANGTPVTIEYDLAEEIVIPYTPEQEEAYYELQHLLMYEGYTKIECIDEIKPDIQGTYYFNNELNKSYGERFDEVDNNIKELEDANIYSTEEQVIGKWIDGKTLYRKVFTSSTFSTSYSIPIINADKVIDIKGIINRKDYTNMIVPIPSRVTDSSMKVDYQYLDRVSTRILVSLAYGTSWSESLFNEVTFIIEYTKTTD